MELKKTSDHKLENDIKELEKKIILLKDKLNAHIQFNGCSRKLKLKSKQFLTK